MARRKPGNKKRPMRSKDSGRKKQEVINENVKIINRLWQKQNLNSI